MVFESCLVEVSAARGVGRTATKGLRGKTHAKRERHSNDPGELAESPHASPLKTLPVGTIAAPTKLVKENP
jgi:hypothetical protein